MKFQNFLASKTVRISPGYSNVIRMCHRILTGSRAKYKLNEKDAKKLLEKQKDKFGKRMSQYAEGCYAVETVNKGRNM